MKKNVKSIAAIAFAVIMAASVFTGCTNSGESNDTGAATSPQGEKYVASLPAETERSDIYVAPIAGVSESFIRGMDISSLLVEEASGVKYFDETGAEQDLFKILADNGINYVRVRVWNDPFDADGNGYGGGNCDYNTAAIIGQRAANYGMKINVDFHYSDFWADPSKQMCPKAWESMSISEKETAIYTYTYDSLMAIIDAGADVGMVQIGNEINNGMAGETNEDNVLALLKQASKAVRDISGSKGLDIKIAVHFTNVDASTNITKKAKWLKDGELDYDIFGISYYSYWHGTLKNMKDTMAIVKASTGKDVMVLETAFPYTGEDGDVFGNSVSEGDITGDYICSPQSQANAVWDVMDAMQSIGGLGIFYWEGAWIPVGSDYASNLDIWNEKGSGWASKYSVQYDPDDAGKYYGGCSWDNQAFFDHEGNVLTSLGVFKYIFHGSDCEPKLEFFDECTVTISQGEEIVMPDGVYGVYNNRSLSKVVPTTWNQGDIDSIDTSVGGEYVIRGVTEDGYEVKADIIIKYVNLLNNSGFEDTSDAVSWIVGYDMSSNPTDIQTKASDAYAGEKAFHFWSDSEEQVFWVEQNVIVEADGIYNAYAYIQGGDVGSDCEVKFYIKVNGEEVAVDDSSKLTGWKVWNKPEIKGVSVKAGDTITVGMYVKCAAGGWGTMDEFCLYKD